MRKKSIVWVLKAILFVAVVVSAEMSFGQNSISSKDGAKGNVNRVSHIRVFVQDEAVCDEIAARLRKYQSADARIMERAFKWKLAKPGKQALIDINNDGKLDRVYRSGDWEDYVSEKLPTKDAWASLKFTLDGKMHRQPGATTFAVESYGYNLKHVPRTKYPSGAFGAPQIDLRQDEVLPWKVLGDPRYEATLITGFYPVLIKGQVFLVFKTSDNTEEPDEGKYPFRRWIIVAEVRPGFMRPSFHEPLPEHLDDICYFIETDTTSSK